MSESTLRTRVTRAEAAKILGTSYQNVRKLQRNGHLHSSPDRYGVHRFERREVETLARKRGLQIKPSGELAARVFAMFERRCRFAEIVIETQQPPETIQRLWQQYMAGFEASERDRDEREQSAHDAEMASFDRVLEQRRRAAQI